MLNAHYTLFMQRISQPALRHCKCRTMLCMQTDRAEGVHRIEQQRKDVEPQVTKWRAYEARALVFQTRKLDFMQQQAESLAYSITATSKEVLKYLTYNTSVLSLYRRADKHYDSTVVTAYKLSCTHTCRSCCLALHCTISVCLMLQSVVSLWASRCMPRSTLATLTTT